LLPPCPITPEANQYNLDVFRFSSLPFASISVIAKRSTEGSATNAFPVTPVQIDADPDISPDSGPLRRRPAIAAPGRRAGRMSALPASIPANAVRIPPGDRLTETRTVKATTGFRALDALDAHLDEIGALNTPQQTVNGIGGPEDPEAALERFLVP
jgi:hypothetical protein